GRPHHRSPGGARSTATDLATSGASEPSTTAAHSCTRTLDRKRGRQSSHPNAVRERDLRVREESQEALLGALVPGLGGARLSPSAQRERAPTDQTYSNGFRHVR